MMVMVLESRSEKKMVYQLDADSNAPVE